MRLRIAILGSYRLRAENGEMKGGAQSACSYLVDAMKSHADLALHVVTMDGYGVEPDFESADGVSVYRIPAATRGELYLGYRTLRRQLEGQLNVIKPDVIHAQDLTMGSLACSIAPDITVLTVHGIVREEARYYASRRERWRSQLRAWWIERTCIRKLKHVIVISPYVRRYYGLFDEKNAYDIPNAIDNEFFDIADPGNADQILYAGRIIPRKRVDELIRVVDVLRHRRPDVSLRIAGDLSNKPYVASLRKMVDERHLSEQVEFLGQLGEASVLEEFRKCRCLVLASAQETAPMVIAQAMAAGKPVVSTPAGGVPEMIEDGRTGYVVASGDFETFAGRIEQVLGDKDLYGRLGHNARAKAEREYRASMVASRTRSVYYDIVAYATDSQTATFLATK